MSRKVLVGVQTADTRTVPVRAGKIIRAVVEDAPAARFETHLVCSIRQSTDKLDLILIDTLSHDIYCSMPDTKIGDVMSEQLNNILEDAASEPPGMFQVAIV